MEASPMADRNEEARGLIQRYVSEKVVAKLDGKLFEHEPATFRFEFSDPEELWAMLQEDYEDYLGEWDPESLVPVASVCKYEESAGDEMGYVFAWLFLDWSHGGDAPRVLATTTDRWKIDERYTVPSLKDLGLKIL
jgi:hypothetical protein